MTNSKADDISDEEFDGALEELLDEMSGAEILATPGAYEVFSEALNNEAIDLVRETKESDANQSETTNDYHCSDNRKTTLCGKDVDEVMYVGRLYWAVLKARNRCPACLALRPLPLDGSSTAPETQRPKRKKQ